MGKMRKAALPERFALYRDLRAIDQRDWYSRKVTGFKRKRTTWRVLLVLTYVIGIVLLIVHGTGLRNLAPFGLLDANYWPLVAATAGGITAFVVAHHYDDLVQSYGYMRTRLTLEIDTMNNFAPDPSDRTDEAKFAGWADRIETLMDAEHQQWHALT